ncbi:DUF4142 domain-containing protein [Streptomyces pluripotens]|uniref:DUF4142 domain-containing protein n=1 Tax=Streptomyces pluripotens TaxID=1355015 RepID=A0A221P3W2_9ACTN|nr:MULTISPECIES: DUF4142 domain-containing protein [Streptomyces]ARP72688.1 hypothetical protein LK06_025095 [Streptomyces pluripotens]ASN26941.1 DUF4142 domain-containing protein [Streptomyces pluripotens]KIE26633.1 hypothetical protein LK08_12940 [Streptomyces sp. MUSC 125]MCH0558780.1 DUF4142 domain-containing protein [Streptomyces sp. MUM 16J]
MHFSRNTIGTVFVGGAMTLTLAALAYPSMLGVQNVSTNTSRIIANTRYGPLTEADRDFVVKVRSAGLWEYRLGQDAMKHGATKPMREAGEHLVIGHALLDDSCRRIATELHITLPNQATPQQQQFVATAESKSGTEFDSTAANIMRVTHGQIFPAIAKIRATTQNTLVRQLADQANEVVLDHIASMEKTGLVNFDQVNFQETTPPKLPQSQLTPPPPQPGSPVVKLTSPPGLKNFYTSTVHVP